MKVDRFFGPEARASVERAVAEAEARSLGQIVPVVVGRSAHYHETRFAAALFGAALATAAALLFRWPITLRELALLQAVAAGLGALAARLPAVERFLAGDASLAAAARIRALRAFHEHGLHRTSRGTGVLVFASLLERRAVILGDHGIHDKMKEGEWQKAVDALVDGLRRDDPAGGFTAAIGLCGDKLAEHFPRDGSAPVNELPDALNREE
ncbi:MAG TPA: TPM domain-containing protein [Anaeromyxobacteraceae bacterium]|jgi:putative membrane protein|nr:TPM domain-containing protein [Anaeromyxobacteraceae bacterium]